MNVEIQDIDSLFHITEPWYIEHCKFDDQKEQLDVYVCICICQLKNPPNVK